MTETAHGALQDFKLGQASDGKTSRLSACWEQMQKDEEVRQKRNFEALKQAQENMEKRAAIKRRNERVIVRQMAPMIVEEMGDALQQGLLDMMNDTMISNLG
jgi:hypothetical protein